MASQNRLRCGQKRPATRAGPRGTALIRAPGGWSVILRPARGRGSAVTCPQPEPGHIGQHHPSARKESPVSAVCEICGKGPGFGNNVSFSHRRTPRRWNPNIQIMRTRTGGTSRRVRVCTSCIKAGKITR